MYEEEVDGTFKRTQLLPVRHMHDNIRGISIPQGQLVAAQFDKLQHQWSTPTVSFHYGKPQSYYQFLREKVALNRFYVFTKPNLSGRIMCLSLHELKLKNGVSQRILSLFKEKYVEAADLWLKQEYRANLSQSENLAHRDMNLMERSEQRIKKFQKSHIAAQEQQRLQDIKDKAYTFFRYDELSITPDEQWQGLSVSSKPVSPRSKKRKSSPLKHFYQRFLNKF